MVLRIKLYIIKRWNTEDEGGLIIFQQGGCEYHEYLLKRNGFYDNVDIFITRLLNWFI